MLVSEKFYQKDFVDEISSKAAYLKACEWVAKNILSKTSQVEVTKVSWRIFKVEKAGLPTFRLELYTTYEEDEINNQVCNTCKEVHSSFYMNSECNCGRCNKEAYRRKIKSKLSIGSGYFKEKLDRTLDKF